MKFWISSRPVHLMEVHHNTRSRFTHSVVVHHVPKSRFTHQWLVHREKICRLIQLYGSPKYTVKTCTQFNYSVEVNTALWLVQSMQHRMEV